MYYTSISDKEKEDDPWAAQGLLTEFLKYQPYNKLLLTAHWFFFGTNLNMLIDELTQGRRARSLGASGTTGRNDVTMSHRMTQFHHYV